MEHDSSSSPDQRQRPRPSKDSGGFDALDWMHHAPIAVVATVRAAIAAEPNIVVLRAALDRAQSAAGDELTTLVASYCQDDDYANVFGRALLRMEPLPTARVLFGVAPGPAPS
jgi:hypothetical protein